jgi:trigger factor
VAVAVEQSRVEVPRTLIERQAESLARDRVRRLEEQSIPLARYLAAIGRTEVDWRRDLVQDAAAMVRRHLVLEKIAEAEQIQVTAEELAAEVAQAADSRLDRAEQTRMREALDQPDARERITTSLRLRKTVQFLADVAAATAARGVPPSQLSSEHAAPDFVGGAAVPAPAESG